MHATPETATRRWIDEFTASWADPQGAEAFADRVEPWLHPQVRFVQPQYPTLVGRRAFRERFVRPLFELIPDLSGKVERDPSPLLRAALLRPRAWPAVIRYRLQGGMA